MAKKNLASLMSGIMGESQQSDNPVSEQETQTHNQPTQTQQATPKRGRPSKSTPDGKTDETRATFIVSESLLRKMKYISLVEGSLLKDVLRDSLESYISNWEKTNGQINLPERR